MKTARITATVEWRTKAKTPEGIRREAQRGLNAFMLRHPRRVLSASLSVDGCESPLDGTADGGKSSAIHERGADTGTAA